MYTLEEVKEKLNNIISNYGEGFNFLAVFGSVAKGDNTESSDIDLMYDIDSTEIFVDFLEKVRENFKDVEVDFVPLMEVLKEDNDDIFEYFIEGSEKIYESKGIFNLLKDERLLSRYNRAFNYK